MSSSSPRTAHEAREPADAALGPVEEGVLLGLEEMALAPAWLNVLSHFMPFRYLVDAVRDAYVGRYATPSMLYGVLVAAGFAALSVTVGTHVFRKAGA